MRLRSVGAVAAGLIAIIVLSNGTDTVLELTGVFPPLSEQLVEGFTSPWMVSLALAYRVAFLVAGGYLTAVLAPSRPIAHVVTLAAVGTVLGIVGVVATWGVTAAWFSVAVLLLGPPMVWLGGRLAVTRGQRRNVPKEVRA